MGTHAQWWTALFGLALGLGWGTAARAGDVPLLAGDIGFQYGRNWGQELMISGLVGELKLNVLPFVSVGVHTGAQLGVSVSAREGAAKAKAFTNLPLALKGELFLGTGTVRPYGGLAMGVSRATGAGAIASVDKAASYSVSGPMPTLAPELGLDLGHFRVALTHAWLFGSARRAAASVTGASISTDAGLAPGLSGTTLQLGAHFGGPRG